VALAKAWVPIAKRLVDIAKVRVEIARPLVNETTLSLESGNILPLLRPLELHCKVL
jgi:hypothetical protein